MSSDNIIGVEHLKAYVEKVEALCGDAESQLSLLAGDNPLCEEQNPGELIEKYEEVDVECSQIYSVMFKWDSEPLPPLEKSDVTYSLGRLKRLHLVTKNILRISRRRAGILDPEQLQEEMNVHFTMNKF